MSAATYRCCMVLALLCIPFVAANAAAGSRERVLLVRITATPLEALQLVRNGVDLVETRDGPDVLALVDDLRLQRLQQAGWEARVERVLIAPGTQQPESFREGYRTVVEVEQLLKGWETTYPTLVQIEDYGDSWERAHTPNNPTVGHDLWALRLTDEQFTGAKPRFFLMAALHARELSTTEVALRWAEELLQGYGTNPIITKLLQTREIWIVPIANPDGRVRAETDILWRKNTNLVDAPCADQAFDSHGGVDLNRNFSWHWGTVDQPSLPFCQINFPGTSAASEPEVAGLQSLLGRLFTPQVDGVDSVGCERRRTDTSGIMISLHSYGDNVLYPWGDTENAACLKDQLAALGEQFGASNRYLVQQASMLYPTSGITDDWTYGTLGIASFTFEIGPADSTDPCSGFFPPFRCVDDFYAKNRMPLFLAATVANSPYQFGRNQRVYMPIVQR